VLVFDGKNKRITCLESTLLKLHKQIVFHFKGKKCNFASLFEPTLVRKLLGVWKISNCGINNAPTFLKLLLTNNQRRGLKKNKYLEKNKLFFLPSE